MADDTVPCAARHLDHVCIAVKSIQEAMALYQRLFDLGPAPIEEVPSQGVRACLLPIGGTRIEFIEPTDPNGAIARFIERRGEALHHVAFQVEDIAGRLAALQDAGVDLIDKTPRKGAAGTIAFLHPRATRGVLIELVEKE